MFQDMPDARYFADDTYDALLYLLTSIMTKKYTLNSWIVTIKVLESKEYLSMNFIVC